MVSMDLMKMWGNILAHTNITTTNNNNNNNSIGINGAMMPTTYFMQGVQVFAYANESNDDNDEESNSNLSSSSSRSVTHQYADQISLQILQQQQQQEQQHQISNDPQIFPPPSSSSTSDDDISDDDNDDNEDNDNDDEHEEDSKNKKITIEEEKLSARRRIQRIRYSREEYKCTMCKYTCTTEKAFLKHLRSCESSEGENPTSAVRVNRVSRVAEPKISCPICGKDRDDEQSILVHMRKHKDEKHFCCDLCKFRTLQLKKLIQHRRMHTGEKPHLCPFCTYRSARRDNLRSHVRRVHKKDNLTCDTFTPRSMLLAPSKKNNF